MNILVTGAAGFIGSNLCEYLLQRNHTVIGIDNFNEYYSPKVKRYNIKDFVAHKNFKLYETDILDKQKLQDMFDTEKIDAVVHLAAWAGVTYSIEHPNIYVRNNIEGTVNLADLAVKHNIKSFLFASTSSIYGNNSTPFSEEMPTDHPLAPYPATKKACEVMLSTYQKNFGLNVTIFRIFNPLGKRLRPDLAITNLVRSCLYKTTFNQYQDSNSTGRDYAYVLHMFEAFEKALDTPFDYEIFNLGNSNPVTLGELIKTVEEVTNEKANIEIMPERKGEMQFTYANIKKSQDMLGYNPTTNIRQIVHIYYNWFVEQEEWYKKGVY